MNCKMCELKGNGHIIMEEYSYYFECALCGYQHFK